MNAKVKVKRGGHIVELDFKHVERILNENSKDFEIVDKDKYKFDGKELIKLSTKAKKEETK